MSEQKIPEIRILNSFPSGWVVKVEVGEEVKVLPLCGKKEVAVMKAMDEAAKLLKKFPKVRLYNVKKPGDHIDLRRKGK